MEKNKAIQLLERLQDPDYYQITSEAFDALQMAIDALSADGDTISRKVAIERATKEHDFFRGAVTVSDKARRDELLNVMCWLGELPPAQPERTPMQELLDTTADRDYWKAQCHSYEMTINRLTESAQPERIRGHWIESDAQNRLMKNLIAKGETWRVCDKCGAGFMIGYQHESDKIYHETFHNFCPKCGAEMEVDDGPN